MSAPTTIRECSMCMPAARAARTVGRHAGRGEHEVGVDGDPVVERDSPVVDRFNRYSTDVAHACLVEQPEQPLTGLVAQPRVLRQRLRGHDGHVDALQRHRGRGFAADESGTDDYRRTRARAGTAQPGGIGQ